MSEDFWTALSAIATAAAFIAVAWQSVLTRQALKVAQEALATSETVALDAARVRLDAEAPDVSVTVIGAEWPPMAWTPTGMPVNAYPAGHEWHFPAGQDERLVLQARIRVENRSPVHLSIEYSGDLYVEADHRPLPAPARLLPRSSSNDNLYLQKAFTIGELAENYAAQQAGEPLPHRVKGTITVNDPRDNGVTDTWELDLTGWPVQPNEQRAGIWSVVGPHAIEGSGSRALLYNLQPPRQRTYWISRAHQQQLPEPKFPDGRESSSAVSRVRGAMRP